MLRSINRSFKIVMMFAALLICLLLSTAAAQQPPPPPPPAPSLNTLSYDESIEGTLRDGQTADYGFYGAFGDYVRIRFTCVCADGTQGFATPVMQLILASGTVAAEVTPQDILASRDLLIVGDVEFAGEFWLELPESGDHIIRLQIDTSRPEGQPHRLTLFGIYGTSGEWNTSPPFVEENRNAVWNPGAEDAPIRNVVQGWSVVSGAWAAPYDPAGALEGISYFTPADGTDTELTQDIDVSLYDALIDRERAYFYLSASFRSGTPILSETPDAVRVIVDYRAEFNSPDTLGNFDTGGIDNARDWRTIVNVLIPPPGTRWLRVRLLTTRLGARHDARFDAVSLHPVGVEVLEVERWQDGMTLVGYNLPRLNTADNRSVLTLYWMATASLLGEDRDLRIEIYDSADRLLSFAGYSLRFRAWLPGRLISTTHLFDANLTAPGTYRVRLVWSDADGASLPMRDGLDESNFTFTVLDPNATPQPTPGG